MGQFSSILPLLICKLMMIGMMFFMFAGKKRQDQHGDTNNNAIDSEISEIRKENQELKKELLSIKSVLTNK